MKIGIREEVLLNLEATFHNPELIPFQESQNKALKKIILKDYQIHYCLGVTPYLADDPFRPTSSFCNRMTGYVADIIEKIASRTDIALHGLTHRTRDYENRSEFNGMVPDEVEQAIIQGIEALDELKISPLAFIPPFNSITISALPVLSNYFEVLCGGPESVVNLGFRPSPSRLCGMIYLPSYPPVYGLASEMQNFVNYLMQISLPTVVPLTLHWAWEEKDDFRGLRSLCAVISGRTIALRDIIGMGESESAVLQAKK